MNLGDILCEYIYSSFLLVKAAVEVAIKTAKTLLKALDTLFNTFISVCKYVIDVAIETVLQSLQVYQKWLNDKLLNLDFSSICSGLYSCNEFVESLLDSESLLNKAIKKVTNRQFNTELVNSYISDFNEFKNQICNFNISFDFGISSAKSVLSYCNSQCSKLLDTLNSYKEKIVKFLQKYLDKCYDMGAFDLLDKLKKYFHCVIIDTDACSSIYTANSFYLTALNKMCLEENGSGYKLNSSINGRYLSAFNSRLNELNNSKLEIEKILKSMVNSSQLISSRNVFNLAENIFPGGMSFKDIKNGNWSKNKCVNCLKIKGKEFKKYIQDNVKSIKNISLNKILSSLFIDDNKKEITLTTMNEDNEVEKITFNSNILPDNVCECVYDPVEYNLKTDQTYSLNGAYYDKDKDEIVSNIRAAIDIKINGNEDLKNKCQSKFNFIGYTSENYLIKQK